MSCYEWEAGHIVIPSKEWSKFRKGLLTAWNEHLDTLLAKAKRAHKAAVAAGKGKRGENRQKAMKGAVARVCGGRISDYGYFEGGHRREAHDLYETITNLLWTGPWNAKKFGAPKKKDMPYLTVSKGGTVLLPDASITFDNTTRTVHWDVPENNRACEAARDHWFARKFFAALARITWTRGSGGEIVGNNEYNEDEYGHRGNRYVVATYRPLTAAEKRARADRERRNRSRW